MEKSDGSMYWPGRFHDGSVSGDFEFVTVFLKKAYARKREFTQENRTGVGQDSQAFGTIDLRKGFFCEDL